MYCSLLNHDADARNSDGGKQLVGYLWEPQCIPGEDASLFRFCKSAIINDQWRAILRSGNARRHGFLAKLPGCDLVDHVVPRIAVVSQDTKEQVLTAGVLSSYCVRCETFVKPRFQFDAERATAADPNLEPPGMSMLVVLLVYAVIVSFWFSSLLSSKHKKKSSIWHEPSSGQRFLEWRSRTPNWQPG